MITFRPESAADHVRVDAIVEAAFGRPLEAEILAAIRGTEQCISTSVAVDAGQVVAQVLFSRVRLDDAGELQLCALGPVAVDPPRQGEGIGSGLIRAALEPLSEGAWDAIFLLGNPRYYARFGFELAAPLGFHYSQLEFDPAFQVLKINDKLASHAGWIEYPAAFGGR
jgi:putative acetyltransferase